MTDPVMDEPSQNGPVAGTEPQEPVFPDNTTGPNFLTYEGACVRILQIVGGLDATPISPNLIVERVQAFFSNTDAQVRMLHEALDQQNGVLMALAALSGLEQGHLYTEMIDTFKSWKPAEEQAA